MSADILVIDAKHVREVFEQAEAAELAAREARAHVNALVGFLRAQGREDLLPAPKPTATPGFTRLTYKERVKRHIEASPGIGPTEIHRQMLADGKAPTHQTVANILNRLLKEGSVTHSPGGRYSIAPPNHG